MKKTIQILLLTMVSFSLHTMAQSTYFKIIPGSVEMQVLSRNGDSLALGYKLIYKDTNNTAYAGTITTNFKTGINSSPASCLMVFNTNDLPNKKLNSGDTALIYTHIKVSSHYFSNGSGNIIVIWPTGDKGSKKIYSKDSITYPKKVTVINLAGIADPNNLTDLVSIFPNPANAILNLNLKDPSIVMQSVQVLDINGQILKSFNKGNIAQIDISDLKYGIYFITIDCGENKTATYKFIVGR